MSLRCEREREECFEDLWAAVVVVVVVVVTVTVEVAAATEVLREVLRSDFAEGP